MKDTISNIENNTHTLFIEIYKSLNHISPPIMQEIFNLKVTSYSLRNNKLKSTEITLNKYFTIWYASTPTRSNSPCRGEGA